MSKTILINNFSRGIADDKYQGRTGECSVSKHFDVLTNPRRLQPLRGMTSHTSNTTIGNLIAGNNGYLYGVGVDASNPSNGKLWVMADYGAVGAFAALSTNQLSGATVNYDLLVDWSGAGNVRTIHWASNNLLVASDPAGGSSATTQALTFTSIGQGFVHPKDKNLYIPYRTSSASYIALLQSNATPFGSLSTTAFTLPSQYRVYCLTNYGDYLAIPATSISAVSDVNSSVVYLCNRDTSLTTFSEVIPWGAGQLKVINNLGGALIGVSEVGSDTVQAGTTQDYNAIQIKVYNGGSEPTLVKELKAFHLAGTNRPSVSINPRVNFIYQNRLYFSVNIKPNDSVQDAIYGLFSVGRNKLTGEWTVTVERMATNTGTETGVIAAIIVGDYVEMVHTAEGTLTKTINGQTSDTTYAATSFYETVINPDMPDIDKVLPKQIEAIGAYFLPLPTSATVTLKYRVDSTGGSSDWVTVGTQTTAGSTSLEMPKTASSGEFNSGKNIELRVESTGGAVITGLAYKYITNKSLIQ